MARSKMPAYRVRVTRQAYQIAYVELEADTDESAKARAMARVRHEDFTTVSERETTPTVVEKIHVT